MALKTQIDADIKQAMLAKDKDSLRALRAIKSLILLDETKEGAHAELSTEDELRLLTKAAKQRRDSMEIFSKQNRTDLAEAEQAELTVIEKYMPKQLTAAELEAAVRTIITGTGAKGPSDMGKVMGAANKALTGRADGKAISAVVKELLASINT